LSWKSTKVSLGLLVGACPYWVASRTSVGEAMQTGRVIVVGGGPKACALAAKAAVLSDLGMKHPKITIVEKVGPGAHWGGRVGFTDGVQELCTPMLRDVGFPYADLASSEADQKMLAYSWASFLVSGNGHFTYSDWVSSGCGQASHSHFSEYLEWVLQKASLSGSVEVCEGEVTGIDFDRSTGHWSVDYEGHSADIVTLTAESVVVTGIQ